MTAPAPGGDPSALPPGTRIDDYEVRQWLGGGGFGITYLARDLQLDLPVALKEYFPADCACRADGGQVRPRGADASAHEAFATGLDRFIAEARALATFRHPHIVRVLRHLRANGTAYIVMEYERGEPLPRWVASRQPLDEAQLMALLLPLLDGLEAVHAAGFLHRDIKPDNIHVREDGSPVLLDFGAARRLVAGNAATSIVSPGFAPFEQYHAQGDQGPWSDLYALGCVVYWLVTGRKPMEAAARIQADSLPPARTLAEPGRFSATLLEAVDWAIRPDASARPRSVAQWRQALQALQALQAFHAGQPAQTARSSPSGPGTIPRLPTLPGPDASELRRLSGRNVLASIAAIDLIPKPFHAARKQLEAQSRLHALVNRVLQGLPNDRFMAQATEEGVRIGFLGDPEEALDAALLLRDLASQRHSGAASLRIGLHLGLVRVMTGEASDGWQMVGDGCGVASRIAGKAQGQEVLASGAFFDAIAPSGEARVRQFSYLCSHQEAQGRSYALYRVERTSPVTQRMAAAEAAPPASGWPSRPPTSTPSAPPPPSAHLAPHQVAELEALLSQYVGPVARILVWQQLRLSPSASALVEALAEQIRPASQRSAFLKSARTGISRPSAKRN